MTILVLGGAGFVGSQIAKKFLERGDTITVMDGFFKETGADKRNLTSILNQITLISKPIEEVSDLSDLVGQQNIIVDCMAWTAHQKAMTRPNYDLELNLRSHLHLINSLTKFKGSVIYLGSRSQFGKDAGSGAPITEERAQLPTDVQGVHKTAAESLFRIYSAMLGFRCLSLRFGNCFGPHQPTEGDDIGLVGDFIRRAQRDEKITVYNPERLRDMIYVDDVARAVVQLARQIPSSFSEMHLKGTEISIGELASLICKTVNKGKLEIAEMPASIRAIDSGSLILSDAKFQKFTEGFFYTDIESALASTVQYFSDRTSVK